MIGLLVQAPGYEANYRIEHVFHNINDPIVNLTVDSSVMAERFVSIFVRTERNVLYTLDIKLSDTIKDVKTMIQEKEGISPDHQQLCLLNGKPLDDGCTLSDYGIQKYTTLYLKVRPRKIGRYMFIYV